jgi:hypothetical protein
VAVVLAFGTLSGTAADVGHSRPILSPFTDTAPTPGSTSTPAVALRPSATSTPDPTAAQTASPTSTPGPTSPVSTPTTAPSPPPSAASTPTPSSSPSLALTPTTTPSPPPSRPPNTGSAAIWVGVDAGKWSAATDIKGAVSYVRLDTPSSALVTSYTSAGISVIDAISGPYSAGGVSAVDANAWAANAVAAYRANPQIVAIEVLNEPGGTWFWGAGALSQSNATAYANLLKTVHNAFVSAFGANRPVLLASYDGGYSSGSPWGQEWTSADPNALTYIDGITIHPYGGPGSVSSSALGNRANIAAAEAQTHMPIYITEVGWPTAVGQPATGDSLQWSEADQATNVYNFVNWARSTGYVRSVVVFNYRDYGSKDWYGITRGDGTHKKSYEDLRRAAQGLPQS